MTYKIQIDDVVRDATAEEIEEIEARHAAQLAAKTEADAKFAQKQAIADRLGLTADELKLLVG